jgi:predicted 3-demethylubiquinone-9 3-methyltransferase (glyoxalase superfamily)
VAGFYTSIFDNSRILHVARYGEAGLRPAGRYGPRQAI